MVAPSPSLLGVRFPYCDCKASQRGFSATCAWSPRPPGSAWSLLWVKKRTAVSEWSLAYLWECGGEWIRGGSKSDPGPQEPSPKCCLLPGAHCPIALPAAMDVPGVPVPGNTPSGQNPHSGSAGGNTTTRHLALDFPRHFRRREGQTF